jgi:hypothetical protein
MPRTRDWRSPEAADALKDLDRSGVAWEFLRRDPEYCEHYASVVQRMDSGAISRETALGELSDRWGCMFIRDPNLAAKGYPLIWRPDLAPLSVTLVAAPDGSPEAHGPLPRDVDAARVRLQRPDGLHLLIDDADGDHRLWFPGASASDRLAAIVVLDDRFAFALLHSFVISGALPDALPAHCRRAGVSAPVTSDVSRSCCARSTAISPVPAIERSPMRSSALGLSLAMPGRPLRSAARQSGSSQMPLGR